MTESVTHFLVIRLSSIGDIVHTLPAVAALGRANPLAEIHWAVEDRFSDLIKGNPYVSHLIKLDTLGWRNNLASTETIAEIMRRFEELREIPYDAAIDFQGLMKSAIFAWLSHSKKRMGFSWRWLREPLAGVFYTDRVMPLNDKHVIDLNLSLVEPLGVRTSKREFPLPDRPEDREAVREQLRGLGTDEFIIINPGGGWKSKRWAPENYGELARQLARQMPFDILVTGSEQENGLAREILSRANSPCVKWFPSSLLQFVTLARKARLLIGGDTGPLHLAAAVGTPIIAIFNSNDPRNTPERNGPFNPADIILYGPKSADRAGHSKHANYLEGVTVESVVNAALRRLESRHE